MTEVKYFHSALVLTNLIVNQDRAMQELADARPFSDWVSHAGKRVSKST
jgi:hypothetical protein